MESEKEKSTGSSSALKSFLAGGFGGICLVLAGHPLDTIKVRLQTQPKVGPGKSPQFKGTFDCAMKTISKEGLFGLYKGMATPILGATPLCAIFFLGFSVGVKLQQNHPGEKLSYFQIFKAGMLSGVFTTSLTPVVDRIKCSLQIQQASGEKAKYTGPIDCAKKIYRKSGFRGLYKGTAVTLLRDVPANGVYFLTYEVLLKHFTPVGKRRSDVGPLGILTAGGREPTPRFVDLRLPLPTLCPLFQKNIGWMNIVYKKVTPAYPKFFHFIVNLYDLPLAPDGTFPNGIRDVFRHLMREEGLKGLFKGLTPIMLRSFPANAACFLGYETCMKFLDWIAPNW